jgi:hypothetical protein
MDEEISSVIGTYAHQLHKGVEDLHKKNWSVEESDYNLSIKCIF